MEPSGHSGAALAHRIVKANSVCSAWRQILLNPDIPLRAKAEAFGISAANSLLWQAGNWALTESELSRLGSWGARKFYAMSCKKRCPNHSVGDHWKHMHRVEHELAALFFAGNIILLVTSVVFNMVPSRLLCSRFLTWHGGSSNRKTMPSSKTSGMTFIHRGSTVGGKAKSNKLPDQLTVTPRISAGNKSRKTVFLGWHPGRHLLHVHSGEQPEQICHVGVFFVAFVFYKLLEQFCFVSLDNPFVPIQLRPCLGEGFASSISRERERVLCRFLVPWCGAEFHGLSLAANFPFRVSFQTCLATVVCVLLSF